MGRWRRFGTRSCTAQQEGFSVVEVLVAFAMSGLILTVFFDVAARASRASLLSDDHMTATMLAQSTLAEAGISRPLVAGRTEGQFDEVFRWQLTIAPANLKGTPTPGLGVVPFLVSIEIKWQRGRTARRLLFRTLRLATTDGAPS